VRLLRFFATVPCISMKHKMSNLPNHFRSNRKLIVDVTSEVIILRLCINVAVSIATRARHVDPVILFPTFTRYAYSVGLRSLRDFLQCDSV